MHLNSTDSLEARIAPPRRMIAIKLLVVAVFAIAIFTHHIYEDEGAVDLLLEILASILLLVSAFGRVWASAHISGKKSRRLVVDGPYSVVRNPLYFASFLGFIGAGLAFESLTLALILGVVFFVTHSQTITTEEDKLRGIFGEEYERYMQRVPRLFPRTWKPTFTESVQISPKAFGRAVVECGLIGSIFILAHAVEWLHLHHVLPVFMRIP